MSHDEQITQPKPHTAPAPMLDGSDIDRAVGDDARALTTCEGFERLAWVVLDAAGTSDQEER